MARYIDLEELIKRIRDNVLSDDNATPYEMDLVEWCKDECIRQGYAMPAADVAPKSEDNIPLDVHEALKQRAKVEVAREIFEGVDSLLDLACHMIGIEILSFPQYTELKKKYTEGKE